MKLSNIFKEASPFVSNVVTLLVVFFLFVQDNQTQIESILNNGSLGSLRFHNVLAVLIFIGGLVKAFSSPTGQKNRFKDAIIPLLIKLLTFLTREPETPVNNSDNNLPPFENPAAPPEKPTP